MQTVYAWGFPLDQEMPYISFQNDKSVLVGDTFFFNTQEYEVYQADKVTHANQLQNIYVRPKGESDAK